ncbi:MAG: ABC transporter substrate-binding protein [Methanothrix sp.]|nr:ABC transporter substrate-binding protein [Methanothrix sp.]
MRIGYLTTLYHTSFILRASGKLDDLGIYAEWKLFPNGPAMMDAFWRKELDLGYVGLPPAMIGIDRGLKIKCIAGGHVEGTVLIGGSGFEPKEIAEEALAQFRGLTIGTPKRGSIHDVILRKLISNVHLDNDIVIKNFDWADFILDAMLDGEVDGGCGTPPLAVLASRQGARILLPADRTWPFNPSYGIVASESLIGESPSLLEDFLKLHEDACNLIRTRPEEAAMLINKIVPIIDMSFALKVFRVSAKYCASLPAEYIDSSLAFVPALKEMGYLSRNLGKEDIFDTNAIERVHPERHHYLVGQE